MTLTNFLLSDIERYLDKQPTIFCDNISALHLTVNLVFDACAKHKEIDYHFIREKVALSSLITCFISSTKVADILAKALPREKFLLLRLK